MDRYDAVILGAGPAGRKAADVLVGAGRSVAMVEDYGFGGTCPLRGCEPKKLLVDAANAAAKVRDMMDQGLDGRVRIDWPSLMRFNRSFVDPLSDRVETSLNLKGVDTFFGRAAFVGANAVEVDGEVLEADHVLVATGAKPRPLDFPGREHVRSSDDFLALDAMPRRVLFVGGGFVSFELGHLAAQAGAQVTILEVMPRPLGAFDPDLVDLLVQRLRRAGLDVRVNCPVAAVETTGRGYKVWAGPNGRIPFEADLVVHGAGRVPDVDELYLEKAGVAYSKQGVQVDEFMRTNVPHIYAAGDAAATTHPLTPVADREGDVAARNILQPESTKADHRAIPSAVYTYPPLAEVGLSEAQAENTGLAYKKIFQDTSDWTEYQRIGLDAGGFKILVDPQKDEILGAHVLGHRAEEVINVFALAIRHHLTISQLKETLWAYPSFIYQLKHMLP